MFASKQISSFEAFLCSKLLRLTCDMEFILGNDKLSFLTMNKRYMLRIELEDFVGQKRYAMYSTFTVRPSTDKYRLIVGGYSGNAGIMALIESTAVLK